MTAPADASVAAPPAAERPRVWLGLAASAASGVLAFSAFPPFELWPLIWVAFVPMLVAQHHLLPRRYAGVAFGLAVGVFLMGYLRDVFQGPYWIVTALVASFLLVPVGWFDRRFQEATRYRFFVFVTPVLWVGLDYTRAFVDYVATWAYPGYALFRQTWLIQPVEVFGVHGLNLLILVTNYALAALVLSVLREPAVPRRTGVVGAAVCAAVLSGWIWYSVSLLDEAPPAVTVAAVQPGRGLDPEEELRASAEMTRAAAAQGAELVVWREKAFDLGDPDVRSTIAGLAAAEDVHLVVGHTNDDGSTNEASIFGPTGAMGTYAKRHPVPFLGEASSSRDAREYPLVRDTAFGALAAIICYDLDFTDAARDAARAGAEIVAVPSWDWPGIADKHYTHLVFRAVENRLAMIKADRAFDSAIIDPYGRLVAHAVSSEGSRRVLVAQVELGHGRTVSADTGDWIGIACVALSALLALAVGAALFGPRRRASALRAGDGGADRFASRAPDTSL